MRGYISFLLVFASVLLFLSLMELRLASGSTDLSSAIRLERANGFGMNAKEAAAECIRQGARDGFADYDSAHSLGSCAHCPDNICAYPVPPAPPPPNFCDATLCLGCFRESGARLAAEAGAAAAMRSLSVSDGDFEAAFGGAEVESFLRHDPAGRNGFALDSVRLREPLPISFGSVKLRILSSAALPRGLVVR